MPLRVRAVRWSGLAGGGGQQRAQAFVGDAVAGLAEHGAERLLAEALAAPAGVGQDGGGGGDDLAVEARIGAAVILPAAVGLCLPLRRGSGQWPAGGGGGWREVPGRGARGGGRQGAPPGRAAGRR